MRNHNRDGDRTSHPGPATKDVAAMPPVLVGVAADPQVKRLEWVAMATASVLVLAASYAAWWPISIPEAWGFVTGGACVWLVVRQHVWNWPIGLANNVFFFILFFQGRLFADMSLQVLYFGLGLYGWRNWLKGGANRSPLQVSRATRAEWWGLAMGVPLAACGVWRVLVMVNGAAPFWDAVTTVLSRAAQFRLTRKRLENWWFWIAADVIYIPLYVSRSLPLTAALYGVFLAMCLMGWREWKRSLIQEKEVA